MIQHQESINTIVFGTVVAGIEDKYVYKIGPFLIMGLGYW